MTYCFSSHLTALVIDNWQLRHVVLSQRGKEGGFSPVQALKHLFVLLLIVGIFTKKVSKCNLPVLHKMNPTKPQMPYT